MKKESTNPFDILSQLYFDKEDTKSPPHYNNMPDDGQQRKFFDFKLRVWLEKKHRGGKSVSLITGIELPIEDLREIAKRIKSKLGVGGSVVEGSILIQSQKRDAIIELLRKEGFKDIKKAGG